MYKRFAVIAEPKPSVNVNDEKYIAYVCCRKSTFHIYLYMIENVTSIQET